MDQYNVLRDAKMVQVFWDYVITEGKRVNIILWKIYTFIPHECELFLIHYMLIGIGSKKHTHHVNDWYAIYWGFIDLL